MKKASCMSVGLAALLVFCSPGLASAKAGDDYRFVSDTNLGAPGFGDYVTFDPSSQRLYVSQLDKVTVLDTARDRVVGSVNSLRAAHGVAIVSDIGRGYVSDGEAGILRVFDLTDFHTVKDIKIADDVDGVIYDPKSKMIIVVAGDAKSISVVDPQNDAVKTYALPGKPEYLATNGSGKVFINITDLGVITRFDIRRGIVETKWPLGNCRAPHGLSYDAKSNRLFTSCANKRLVVVDASSGKNIADLPIGYGSDAVAVDSRRRRVFSANADGTLDVIQQLRPDHYAVARVVPTFFGGRNMAIDPRSGTIYVAHGHTVLVSGTENKRALRFGFDGLNVARFDPGS